MSRRLVALLLVVGLLVGFSVPAAGQDKDKDKDKAKAKEPDKGGDKVTLKWTFVKDKTFYQKMVTKTAQSMKVLGTDVNQTQNQTFYFSYKPTKVAADSVEIEQEIIGVAMDIDIGGSKISYDSTKDTTANNPLGDFFKALVGSKFTITLDPKTYRVTKVDGRDQFIQKLVAANPQMKQLLETILSNDALKEMAEPTFAVIPGGDKPIAKGEKWTRKSTLDMGPIGKYENEYNFLLESVDANVAKIKVDTVLNYKEPGEVAGQGGLPFKIKSAKLKSSNPVGQISFDNGKGRLDRSTLKLELKGDLKIEIGGQTTEVTLSQTQDSSIETSDTNPVTPKK